MPTYGTINFRIVKKRAEPHIYIFMLPPRLLQSSTPAGMRPYTTSTTSDTFAFYHERTINRLTIKQVCFRIFPDPLLIIRR